MEKTLSNSRPLECDGNAQAERQEPLAFERKALLECPVAGIGFHDIDDVWDELYVGAKIALVRERCNKYDRNAVAVALADDYDGDPDGFDFNFILGYIPRTCNSAIAAILDMGHGDIIEAEISEMNDHAPYPERLHITVYVKAKTPLPPRDNRLRICSFEKDGWNAFADDVWRKGVALFRWGGFPPWELDLPKRGDKVAFVHKAEETAALYLMTVIATGDDCAPYVENVEDLHWVDDCNPYALTVVKGPVSVRNEELGFLGAALETCRQPDFKLDQEDSDALMEIFGI
mgnify:FL=1